MRLDRLTTKAREAVMAASQIAAEMGNPELYPEQLLAALREVRGTQRVTDQEPEGSSRPSRSTRATSRRWPRAGRSTPSSAATRRSAA
jgi:hypothetical protein